MRLGSESDTVLADRTLAVTTGLAGVARRAGVEFSAQAIGGMFGIYFAWTAPDTFATVMACDKDRFNRRTLAITHPPPDDSGTMMHHQNRDSAPSLDARGNPPKRA
jgi:hypothetical protein